MERKLFDDLSDRDHVAREDDFRAAKRDEVAAQADGAAEERDQAAKRRDATAQDDQATQPDDRSRAAADRERARQDRAAAEHDRWRAGEDRGAAHDAISQLKGLLYQDEDNDEVMLLLGQAQGMIMAASNSTPLQALLELSNRAATDGTDLGAAAKAIVRDVNEGREGRS